MGYISVRVFGQLNVTDSGGVRLNVPGRKQQALLVYLALNLDSPPSRDKLATMFWGERFDSQARQSLRQAISRLRKTLANGKTPIILTEGDHVGLNPETVEVDAHEFERRAYMATPEALTEAIALYRDMLADGLHLNERVFENWLRGERTRLQETACTALVQLATHHADANETQAAIEMGRRLIRLDPLNEAGHRLLMQVYAASGQRALAMKQYHACAALLLGEFSTQPDVETLRLYQDISATAPASSAKQSMPVTAADRASTAADKPTVVVLPFDNLGSDDDQAYFAIGMTEDIITSLTKYHWLAVISRHSSFSYNGQSQDVRRVAEELGANYVIEGSVRRMQGRLRVTAQLIDAGTGKHIWAERYDRVLRDIFAVQDEITETIAATIEPELAAAESRLASRKPTDSLAAWDCYHLGLTDFYQFNRDSNLEAQKRLRQAIEIDPKFAAAHARLAYSITLSAINSETEVMPELLEEALAVARRAVALDNQDAVAHLAIGRVHLARGEHNLSVAELRTSINLNPCLAQAHCSLGQSLAYSGLLDEAVRHLDEAVRLGPHDPYKWAFLMYGALARLFLKQHETAAQWAHDAVLLPKSSFWANSILVAALGHLDRSDEAKAAVAEILRRKPDFSIQYAKGHVLRLKYPELLDHYVNGLRKAGLPE